MFLSSGARLAGWFIGSVSSAGDSSKRRRSAAARRLAVDHTIRSAIARDGASHGSRVPAVSTSLAVETECVEGGGETRCTRLDQRARGFYTFQAHRLVPPHIRREIARDAIASAAARLRSKSTG